MCPFAQTWKRQTKLQGLEATHCHMLKGYLKHRCFLMLAWETYVPKQCCTTTDFIPLVGFSILIFIILLHGIV